MDQADPERLHGLVRQHWQSENKVHRVREVMFDEDRSHVRYGSIP
jgi:predicted transposase YbfD/YdcC